MASKNGCIVVGVDGSDESVEACAWALEEARLRGAALRVVHAWQYLPIVAEPLAALPPMPIDELVAGARTVAEQVVARATGDTAAGVEVDYRIVEGPAAAAVIDAARDADLLVVGSRGRGGFTGLLLGSVSQQVVHHAPCPVVVLPRHTHRD
jgi:nucleotide-binding universal stress UspA family protein